MRARLAAWSGLIRDYKEDEQELEYLLNREFEPFLRPIVPLSIVEEASPGMVQAHWEETYNDLRFLNLIGLISYSLNATLEEASAIGGEIDQLIAMIETEFERK